MRLMFALATAWMLSTTALTSSAAAGSAILIEFSAAHCAPCQAMQPVLAQLERSGVPIRHVDVAAEPTVAQRYGIRKTPTFIVISGGKEVTRLVGTQTIAQLQEALAIDLSGPLIPTGAKTRPFDQIPAPQTRLAPVSQGGFDRQPEDQRSIAANSQTFTAAAAAAVPDARGEAMPSLSIADAVQRAQAATVRLRVHDGHGYGAGTGTIIDTHGEEALVLTCGHLFRENEGEGKIEVDLFVGGQTKTVLGQVIDYDAEERDIALVAIRPGFAVQPVALLAADEPPRNGQTVFSFGCDRGDDPSRRDTRITGINKYNQHLGASNIEIAGAPIDGRSGGGLFDDRGRLVGVCNAADYKNDVGIYTGPGSVKWQLDRVNLSHLYQHASAQAAIAAAPAANPPVTPPADRVASLPTAGTPGLGIPAEMAPNPGNQEVIVIVRDRNNPDATSRVMTLQQPSADLMQMIHNHVR